MEPEQGALVFTGAGAGIVLGYVDEENEDKTATERFAIVARFADSERVPVNELGSSPAQAAQEGDGQVPAVPSHEGGATDTHEGDTVPFSPSTAEGPSYTGGETTEKREQRQDAELARLSAEQREQQSPGAGPEAAPSASSSSAGDPTSIDPAGSVTSPPATPTEQQTVARREGETTPPVGGTPSGT